MARGRALHAGEVARAAVLCLAPLALARVLASVPHARSTAALVAAQFATFAAASMLLARGIAGPTGTEHRAGHHLRAAWLVVVLAAFSVVMAWCSRHWSITGLTLVGATVEELVFRRELPDALARVLRLDLGRWAGAVSVLLAQSVFAACHATVVGPGSVAGGAVFLRLAAAGVCLAELYRASGTLVIPVAVHFGINWSAVLGT